MRLARPQRLSLRARLLWTFLVPLAFVLVLVGVVSTAKLRDQLVGQVDTRLTSALSRSAHADNAYGPPPQLSEGDDRIAGGPDFLDTRGQGAGTLGARVYQGTTVQGAVITESGTYLPLNAGQLTKLVNLPTDGRPVTVDLGGRVGTYRVAAAEMTDGDVIVTGLPLSSTDSAVNDLIVVEVIAGLCGLAVAAAAGVVVLRNTLRPLERVADTATRVTELPLASGEVSLAERVPEEDTDTRTEVGRVGTALNSLLDHVEESLSARQASEMQVRQFVADASHELRTPLASIRGYAEFVRRQRREGRGVSEEDIAHTLRRVESEAVRMSVLVDDLLLLARLDAGRDLEIGEVDLTMLAVDATSDAHVAAPGHRWHVDVPSGAVVVPGDATRLHQVIANLLTNVRTHTPEGTTATVRVRVDGSTAVLQVIDDGPGIPPELQAHVFERFARGDASRSREAGSTGLGLAIVAAVVSAHDGTVSVESTPGRTAFTVRLPGATLQTDGDGGPGDDMGLPAPVRSVTGHISG
jgi:two-component system OmpR family sensor kinase